MYMKNRIWEQQWELPDALSKAHMPFGILTSFNIERCFEYSAIVLPNLIKMKRSEADILRKYVYEGGLLYASGHTSLVCRDAGSNGNFLLKDLFGVDYSEDSWDCITYIAPVKENDIFRNYDYEHPISISETQTIVLPNSKAKILATHVLPYFDPLEKPYTFASMTGSPPGKWTQNPAIVENRYGKGRVIYCTAALERRSKKDDTFIEILSYLLKNTNCTYYAIAHPSIEITAFERENDIVVHFLGMRLSTESVTIKNISFSMHLNNRVPHEVRVLFDNKPIDFNYKNEIISFNLPELTDFASLLIQTTRSK